MSIAPAFRPARGWRIFRRVVQASALLAVILAPVLGGWQRLERIELSAWKSYDTELPGALREGLPRGESAQQAYEAIVLAGGGTGAELFEVPFADPVTSLALMAHAPSMRALIAFLLPVLLALFAGRVFCGWFCPFGTLSRIVEGLLEFIPFRRKLAFPARRPVRYLILAIGAIAGLVGAKVILYLALPHLLLHQSIYAAWLLGGGGAALGLLLGLILAGVFLGPAAYCATLCPTGAALAAAGHARVVRLSIIKPKDCGSACTLCSQACWLQLEPASGDPGPDCDVCARCVPVCPKDNLQIRLGRKVETRRELPQRKGEKKKKKKALPMVATVVLAFVLGANAVHAQRQSPELVLAAERSVDGVIVAVDVIDRTGIPRAADSLRILSGSDVAIFIARGAYEEPDERGLIPERERYVGPLRAVLHHDGEETPLHFDAATSPISTQRRAIYTEHLDFRLSPGDSLEILPIEGWIETTQRFEVPTPGVDASPSNVLFFFLAGGLLFTGLLSLALAVPPKRTA